MQEHTNPASAAHVAPVEVSQNHDIESGLNKGVAYPTEKQTTHYNGSDSDDQRKDGVNEIDLGAYDAEQDREEANEETKVAKVWKIVKGPNSLYIHIAIELFVTAWWITGLVLHRYDPGWLKPFLVWLAITIRMVTFHVSSQYVWKPVRIVWKHTIAKAVSFIPARLRIPLGALGTVAVFLIGTFVGQEYQDNTRANRAVSLFGLVVFLFVFWVTSRNHKAIQWHSVIVGMLAQFIVAVFVLKSGAGYDIFSFIAELARDLLGYAAQGTSFLITTDFPQWFVFTVIPPIIFFVAFIQLLYYWGWLQFFIHKFATIFFWSMRVSGAEAVVAAASPFVGQGESAMLIKPFIKHLTSSEIHAVMTAGFATISGSVLSAYIGFGISGQALVTSCVMSIPASLALSKLRYPETEEPLTANRIIIPPSDEERPANWLHAFANGGWLGLIIAGRIVAGLLTVLALLGLFNGILSWVGQYFSIDNPTWTVQLSLGYLLYPVAFLLGVDRPDIFLVAQLIGTKIVANEFVAFYALSGSDGTADYANISARSRLIATFAVCGFGNISSLGIQIGILSQLAPGRAGRVAKVAFSALLTGIIATLSSASIAGMLVNDTTPYTAVHHATT